MFLNKEQLTHLTGMKRASDQIRFLSNNGWRFAVNGLGQPVVLCSEVDLKLLGTKGRRASNDESAQGPNWGALKNESQDAVRHGPQTTL
jgi:hypothetical protein